MDLTRGVGSMISIQDTVISECALVMSLLRFSNDSTSGSYLGSLGEFETRPAWAPGVDTSRPVAQIALKTTRIEGFHHRANWPPKVRNVSRPGSQSETSRLH